ncbi:Phage capsid and scaffold [Escherichia coli]|nr:Phage capsid and scaffold [Escherichia coli]
MARRQYPDDSRLHHVLKSAVGAGTTTDPQWAGSLSEYQEYAQDFIDYLRPQTIIGRFGQGGIPALRQVPFNIRVHAQVSGGAAGWVGEGKAKPLTKFDFESITFSHAKVSAIAVLTEELIRFPVRLLMHWSVMRWRKRWWRVWIQTLWTRKKPQWQMSPRRPSPMM